MQACQQFITLPRRNLSPHLKSVVYLHGEKVEDIARKQPCDKAVNIQSRQSTQELLTLTMNDGLQDKFIAGVSS